MKQGNVNKTNIAKRILIIGVLMLLIPFMLFFTYYSFRYSISVYEMPYDRIMRETKDALMPHFVGVFFLLAFPMIGMLPKVKLWKRQWSVAFVYFVMAVTFIFSLVWILNGNFYAMSDSRGILSAMEEMRNGNYSALEPGGYIGAINRQLGMVTIFNIIFTVTGTTNEFVIRVVNVICVPIVIYAGYRILREISGNVKEIFYYGLFALCCFPLFFYTPYVYGELISLTAGMIFIWAALVYFKNGKISAWIALLVCSVIGNLARGNFPVIMIAFAIIAFLYSVRRKDIMPCLCAISLFVAIVLANELNTSYYEKISGIEINQGVPVEAWIAMGLNEDRELGYGMYNGYNVQEYADAGYNTEVAKLQFRRLIKDRLRMFVNGVGTRPADFYKVKLLLQWNDPTLNCFIENDTFIPEPNPIMKEIIVQDGKYAAVAREVLNQYQLFLYMGVLFYAFSLFRKKMPFYHMLIPIILVGAFLFTMLWEAMSRYVLPYIVYMLPVAAIGWAYAASIVYRLLVRLTHLYHS